MRVTLGVDALTPELSGIGRYTWELCKGLPGMQGLDVRYFGHNRIVENPAALLAGDPLPRLRFGLGRFRTWWEAKSVRHDLFHGPNYFLPEIVEHGIITVHDLSVFRYAHTHPADRIAEFEQKFESSLERAVCVITDTETVRQELIKDFSLDPARVTAIHLGVDDEFDPSAASLGSDTLRRLGLEIGGYGLCVSTLEPRKKIEELLDAWGRLPRSLLQRYPLVLVGGSGWQNDSLHSKIERGQAEGWLIYLGYVDEAVLPAIYAGAALFLYPSTYEGFGLPPLEAMASGTPVVVAARSCMPEVCGEAAAYVDPDEPDELLGAITLGLTDEAWRSTATRLGLERAKEFSWARCIEATASLYKRAKTLI